MEDKVLEYEITSKHSNNFPKILKALNISLVISAYFENKLIFIRVDENDQIDNKFFNVHRPMGIYVTKDLFTIASMNNVTNYKKSNSVLENIKKGKLDNIANFSRKVLEKDQELLEELKEKRKEVLDELKKSDSLYVQRASLSTGMLNIHDIAWGDGGLWVVNSTFSCISTLSSEYSFVAHWKPEFISKLVPENRCHVNGMAMINNKPKYVTTFSTTDYRDSWDTKEKDTGTLIDIDTNEILVKNLILPHSPKVYRDLVYFCESGKGVVYSFNPKTKEQKEVIKLKGFTRGLYFYKGLMIVCTSQLRVSSINTQIPLDYEDSTICGIWIVNLENNTIVANMEFDMMSQIYDVSVIEDSIMPNILEERSPLFRHIYDFKEML